MDAPSPLPLDDDRRRRFPLGAGVMHAELEDDPYPLYARLRAHEPVSWVPAHGIYFVTRYDLCRDILLDDQTFAVGFERSPVLDILGRHMMSTDGALARRYKHAHRQPFLASSIREGLEAQIQAQADRLIDGFAGTREVELRQAFASRLPVLVMLDLFGLPASDESLFRGWYDAFEQALANTAGDAEVRARGKTAVARFHAHMQAAVERARRRAGDGSLLSALVHAPADARLSDEEIRHNAAIVLFGGISTVEALILNTIYALALHPAEHRAVRDDPARLPAVIEETIRWLGPVQTAHRAVTRPVRLAGVGLAPGDVVAAILAAANHDPAQFARPDRFDPDRQDGRHLGFATGPHLCLGQHLARAEVRLALERLFQRWPGCTLDPVRPVRPHGAEFRQPRSLWLLREDKDA
jgi:cytochrome P450